MNNVLKLFNGICIIVDDAFKDLQNKKDDIFLIKEILESKNFPIVTFHSIPEDDVIYNFQNISFLLLDWDLLGLDEDDILSGVTKQDVLKADNQESVINFIKKLKTIAFVPIFIFSKDDSTSIIQSLKEEGLYNENSSNYLFVKQKKELLRDDNGEDNKELLFQEIKTWIDSTPSIYVLKEWEATLNKAKRNLFWDFYEIRPDWTKVLWSTFQKDDVDSSFEMVELLFDNIRTRISPIIFNEKILNNCDLGKIPPAEIQNVLEGQRYISNDKLPENVIFTGDIYHINGEYFINVRPQCDCIPRNGESVDEIRLYLIQGEEKKDIKKLNFSKKMGNFSDTEVRCTIFPIAANKAIQFELGNFHSFNFGEIKKYRIGRLLPPFITRIQQKYALYMHRQGLPRIPEEAINVERAE